MAGEATIGVLGAVRVVGVDGTSVVVRGARSAALLARLVAAHPDPVRVDSLIDEVWPDSNGPAALHMAVSRLRALLAGAGWPDAIGLGPRGYRLAVPAEAIDVGRFGLHLASARAALAAGRRDVAAGHLRRSLAEWRGPAFAGVDFPFALEAAARLEELHLSATEDLLELRVEGDDRAAVEDLQDLVAAHPWRERPVALLARALFASGRQVEALAALQALRGRLRDEHGLDPSREIADAEWAILRPRAAGSGPHRARFGRAAPPAASDDQAARSVATAAVGVAVPGVPSVVDVAGPDATVAGFVAALAASLAADGLTVIDARAPSRASGAAVAALAPGDVAVVLTGPGADPRSRELVRRAARSDAAVAIVRARGRAPRVADGMTVFTIRLAEASAVA